MPILGSLTLEQNHFRFRNDDGSETTATWSAAEDTNYNPAVSTNFRLRFKVKGVNSNAISANRDFKIKYSQNGGAYTDVAAIGATTDALRYVATSNFADGDATTEQLTAGSAFRAGSCEEVSPTATITFPATATRETEFEFSLEIYSGAVSNGDTLDIRLYRSTDVAINTYTVTPRITVSVAGGATTASIRWWS